MTEADKEGMIAHLNRAREHVERDETMELIMELSFAANNAAMIHGSCKFSGGMEAAKDIYKKKEAS
jgi:hypothetical protein